MHLLLPLFAAVLYAASSLVFKRAFEEGANTRQSFHWSNWIAAVAFLPFLFLEPQRVDWTLVWQPVLVGFFCLLGTLCTFAAIRRADVSLVTPLMGTKVVFVAVATTLLVHEPLRPSLWVAAALTTAGVLVLGWRDLQAGPQRRASAILLTLASCALFGVADVLLQHYAAGFGKFAFMSCLTLAVALFAGVFLPWERAPVLSLPGKSRRWLMAGCLILSVQGAMMGISLGFFHDATAVNICYSTRGFWSLVLVWFAGAWFGNVERAATDRATFFTRAAGTVLLTVALVLAMLG